MFSFSQKICFLLFFTTQPWAAHAMKVNVSPSTKIFPPQQLSPLIITRRKQESSNIDTYIKKEMELEFGVNVPIFEDIPKKDVPKPSPCKKREAQFNNVFELIAYILCPPISQSPIKKRVHPNSFAEENV